MSKQITLIIILLSLLIFISSQKCQPNINNCAQCHPLTNLCAVCKNAVYKPDQEGGCGLSKQCKIGENYCIECNGKNDICSKCELGFFADENGGCSSTDNCVISENGNCLECKEDFYLIKRYFNFCKYKFSDDFKNCVEINNSTGKCISCEENYYLSSDDNKCTNTTSCRKSTLGICTLCKNEYFLDKTDNLCKNITIGFTNCKISLDGKICSECIDEYFLSKDNICTKSQNCEKADNNSNCIKCSEGYFLSKYGYICTTEKYCLSVKSEFRVCEFCESSFYIEFETRKCFSNQENEKYKFCIEVSSGNCIMCDLEHQLAKDKKCVKSIKCLESANGVCVKCEDGYHLGLDNKCINIEKCIYSNTFGCYECENNYYYDSYAEQCFLGINQYKNCKNSDYFNNYCKECKNDFYLSVLDKMCYSNTENNNFYKCAFSNKNGTECEYCVDDYFLGSKDLKCSKIKRCAVSENENKCIECSEDLCLDVKKQICIENFYAPENDDQKIYYNCNKTNEEGTKCEICNDYSELVNGICVNKIECEEKKNEECIKCNDKNHDNYDMCLNNVYGCVETFVSNCLRCDNIYNFDECTECMEGYVLNDDGECVVKI